MREARSRLCVATRAASQLALTKTQITEQLARAGSGLGAREPRDHLRQNEVLKRGELGQQMMELVDEADVRAPERRPLVVAHGRGCGAPDPHFAGVRPLQQTCQMQK